MNFMCSEKWTRLQTRRKYALSSLGFILCQAIWILHELSRSLKSGVLEDALSSDIILLVENLRRSSTAGYTREPKTTGSNWRLETVPGSLETLESSVLTDSSTRSEPIRYSGTYARLRGESLRCLASIIRAVPAEFSGRWCDLLLDSPTVPGLATLARIDVSAHARRFATFAVAALLKSARIPATNSRGNKNKFVSDTKRAFAEIIGVIGFLLRSGDPEDRSTVCRVITDVLGSPCWSALDEKAEKVNELFVSVVHSIRESSDEDEIRFLLGIPQQLGELSRVSVEAQTAVVDLLRSLYPKCESAVIRLALVRPLSVLSEPVESELPRSILINALRMIADADTSNLTVDDFKAVFGNLFRLDEVSISEGDLLNLISTKIPETVRESFLAGCGKLSRKSFSACNQIIRIKLQGFTQEISVEKIKAFGDLVFSAIIWECGDEQLPGLTKLLSKLLNTPHRGYCLRAIMTGLARLRDTGQAYSASVHLHELVGATKVFLLQVWHELSCEERLAADSLRTIGLLHSVVRFDAEFHRVANEAISKGLLSRKTQRVLASLSSVQAFHDAVDPAILELVSDVFEGYLSDLAERTVWDYASADTIAGGLHIVKAAWDLTSADRRHDHRSNAAAQLRIIGICIQRYRVYQYNKSILDSIEYLTNVSSGILEASEIH